MLSNKSFPIKKEKLGYTIAGSLSGFMAGSVAAGGPPVILFFSNQGMSKNAFRANISFYFFAIGLVTIISHFVNGLFLTIVIEKILYFVPAALLGVISGIKISKRVNELFFKRVVLVVLIFLGMLIIISTIKEIIF